VSGRRPTIAVVGGGPTGTMLAIRMARLTWPRGLRLILVERQAKVGVGTAFATEEPFHLLNVRAGDMSALSEEPAHFFRWAATRIPGLRNDDFVPRLWYGRYLKALFDEAVRDAGAAVVVEHRHAEAMGIDLIEERHPAIPADSPVRVRLDDGTSVTADRVVLAISNLPPVAPAAIGREVLISERYTANPWDTSVLEAIPLGTNVLVVGTGLTMVDVVLWLSARRQTTSMMALSRHGWLPAVHARHPGPTHASCFDSSSEAAPTIRRLLADMRGAAAAAQAEGGDWRDIVDHVRHRAQAIWKQLPIAERRRFLRHCRRLWDVHRHRVADDVGMELAKLLADGRLTVIAGRLVAAQLHDDRIDVTVRLARGATRTMAVDHIVNATGPPSDLLRAGNPLMTQLAAAGLAVPDALGLGLNVSETGALISRRGPASRFLFAAGSLRRGQLWEITAVPELRDQARELAEHLHHEVTAAPAHPTIRGATLPAWRIQQRPKPRADATTGTRPTGVSHRPS
jgi:uncharacterized NAD(P)/FAD-binding protein YdhS